MNEEKMNNNRSNQDSDQELTREDVFKRLRRIEGQVKGLQRMLTEDKPCSEVLVQVAAVKAAMNKVGILIFQTHSKQCLENVLNGEKEKEIDNLMDLLNRFIK
ncbi:protein of unknown function DUF156 [Syntrophobotulus glycolicus DSM 8271]|uniref:Copper-sensing transcriptional repressor CsoR n=1 Tax=Syntrophobotulus glycolicus (strain DSM 8271 / FlGlyR) TaxID=645991 RepID=F0T248_SYNGF|nr:metal-sensitive transcriptional regulator [Syntrophobotulus glycolicus]ADY56392.1 protein of unknown function DUF156 [Syntrophobotulus glycolicus DSM 8271]